MKIKILVLIAFLLMIMPSCTSFAQGDKDVLLQKQLKDCSDNKITLAQEVQSLRAENNRLKGQLASSPVQLLSNPTKKEIADFFAKDGTNTKKFQAKIYEAADFTRDLVISANKAGFHCAEVQFRTASVSWTVVAFRIADGATENELAFFEPQKDNKRVTLKIGEDYLVQNGWSPDPKNDCTISKILPLKWDPVYEDISK